MKKSNYENYEQLSEIFRGEHKNFIFLKLLKKLKFTKKYSQILGVFTPVKFYNNNKENRIPS